MSDPRVARLADLLVNYSLELQPGQQVRIDGSTVAAPLVTDLDGASIEAGNLEAHLQRTRRQRVSMTFNALMCRGLLETRYGLVDNRKEG